MFVNHGWALPINDRGQYELIEPLVYDTHGYRLRIPKGFITDFASIPRWLWSITGWTPGGLQQDAAIIHDYLYQREGRPREKDVSLLEITRPWPARFTRKECDDIFYAAMIELGVNSVKAATMTKAVNIFGRFAW